MYYTANEVQPYAPQFGKLDFSISSSFGSGLIALKSKEVMVNEQPDYSVMYHD
jgi:hypothetical protein